MNILLVYPSRIDSRNVPYKYKKAFLPPLSLALLDRLTPAEHTVHIVNDIVEDIDYSKSYDLVGITLMTTQAGRAYQIADQFRNIGVKVIMGGMHATVLPDEVKEHADSVVIGEAESLWKEILSDCAGGRLKEFYKDTSFPDFERHVIPRFDNMNLKIYPKSIGAKLPMMPIFTTRGCPMGCKFCSVTKYFGKKYRMKPIAYVLEEIRDIGAPYYFIVDDNIACSPDYSRELFRSLPGKDIKWFSQISTTVLKNPDLIELAAKGGCDSLFIGVESIREASLKTVNKGFNNVEQYEELIARMKKAGITPHLSFMFGFDEDTLDIFESTLRFIERNKVTYYTFWVLTPLPGTDFYEEMEKEGRLVYNDWLHFDLTTAVFTPKNMTAAQLEDSFWESYQKLYSIKKIITNIIEGVKITKRNPISEVLETSFYQIYFRKKVLSKDHPFSGGINLIRNRSLGYV